MMRDSRFWPYALALGVPALLLGGAYISQYGFGLVACEMCYWQRWPHMAAILFGAGAVLLRNNPRTAPHSWWLVIAAAIAIAISGGIGAFHAGVEYRWWEGLTACATAGALEPGSILQGGLTTVVVRCDEPQWTLFGVSLAGFNALFSLGAALIIFIGIRKATRPAI